MMTWFSNHAPIRTKLLFAFGTMTLFVAAGALTPLIADHRIALAIQIALTFISAVVGMAFRAAICGPYVTTVVRMEAMAAGDLASPVLFSDYTDCVGRMTQAMMTFREAARAQIEVNAQAEINAGVVRTMATNLRALSEGNLTADITADFPPTYADLKASFNTALGNLRGLVGNVGKSAASLLTGSHEIAQAAEDLARRTEGNAASLEQTSAALVQIEGRLKDSVSASQKTVARADQAITSVGDGRATAEIAVEAMTRVSGSAKGIDSVIEGLDKIAFQTRVLAMNAAVEAGRAGDAGRGFAVVADLVSALAMRAEEEAKRARDQLTVTQTEILRAVDAVQKVDGAFGDIAGDVGAVHGLLASMASDNMAQSSAITQITAAIGSMDKATQQNAAMVEETSAAAASLTTEAIALSEQTKIFERGQPDQSVQVPASRKRVITEPRIERASLAKAPRAGAVPRAAAIAPAAIAVANGASHDWTDF